MADFVVSTKFAATSGSAESSKARSMVRSFAQSPSATILVSSGGVHVGTSGFCVVETGGTNDAVMLIVAEDKVVQERPGRTSKRSQGNGRMDQELCLAVDNRKVRGKTESEQITGFKDSSLAPGPTLRGSNASDRCCVPRRCSLVFGIPRWGHIRTITSGHPRSEPRASTCLSSMPNLVTEFP